MKTVAISILGTSLDRRGKGKKRWDKWRPTVSLCQHDDLLVDRLVLLFDKRAQKLADNVTDDIRQISPETEVVQQYINFNDPWDFESVYASLLDFCRAYTFNISKENYLVHITTGTHVAQICLYLLTEARYLPAKLLQTSPAGKDSPDTGAYQIIDLDLSRYDQIASRFEKEHEEAKLFLKSGIETRNSTFNRLIEQIEQVSIRSTDPMLLSGATGAGKSQLARRIFDLKQQRGQLAGKLVEVNCATLRGENAMSALFGHVKGAFTGATTQRPGLLKEADKGLLFLDEIGELGADEQAMLLRAIEDKRFMPLGADTESASDFQLIAGTNRNLFHDVEIGKFREDLLARINIWSYQLPSLKDRIEDLEPNIDYELEHWAKKSRHNVSFNKAARNQYLKFARSPDARWSANFRDLNASITRMATLSNGGRLNESIVSDEIIRLQSNWSYSNTTSKDNILENIVDEGTLAQMDLFEKIQLEGVIAVCQQSRSMAEAGRTLFANSRDQKKRANDSHRIRQYLQKYDLSFADLTHT